MYLIGSVINQYQIPRWVTYYVDNTMLNYTYYG